MSAANLANLARPKPRAGWRRQLVPLAVDLRREHAARCLAAVAAAAKSPDPDRQATTPGAP